MSEEETWVRFSEVALNARMRNALELFAERTKELPAAPLGGHGGEDAAGLTSEDAKTNDREELKTTQSAQSSSVPKLKSARAGQREQV